MSHNARHVALALLACVVLAACETPPTPAASHLSFTVVYDSGSIPPPANHSYLLSGEFRPDGSLALSYTLTYRYRQGMTDQQLAAAGYSSHDDIFWSGTLTPADAASWRTLVGETHVTPPPTNPPPGSDTFLVALIRSDVTDEGVPQNRTDWEARITALTSMLRETPEP